MSRTRFQPADAAVAVLAGIMAGSREAAKIPTAPVNVASVYASSTPARGSNARRPAR